jgi:hypothetical protein
MAIMWMLQGSSSLLQVYVYAPRFVLRRAVLPWSRSHRRFCVSSCCRQALSEQHFHTCLPLGLPLLSDAVTNSLLAKFLYTFQHRLRDVQLN